MSEQKPTFEWQTIECDADWEQVRAAYPTHPTPPQAHSVTKQKLWSAVAIFLMLIGVSQWWWHMMQQESTAATEQELRALIQHNISQSPSVPGYLTSPEDGLRVAIQTGESAAQADITIDAIELHGDRALAKVRIGMGNSETAQRQTRFYQRSATDWVQITPDAELWGPARSLETPFFVYHFRQNDAQAVVAVLPQMDTLYRTIRRNVGLPVPSTTAKLVIEVSVTHPLGKEALWLQVSDRFIVPSPALYLAPVELTDAELLAQSIALLLLDAVIAQASEQHTVGSTWQPMVQGIGLWQVWDLNLPLAVWRTEIVQWLYFDLPTARAQKPIRLPDHYTELCAAHKLWLPTPLEINIPLLCTDAELNWEDLRLSPWGWIDPPAHLDELVSNLSPELIADPPAASHPGRTVALATLIEYAVATYGRDRLASLVAGLGQHEDWETLIPAVYGVSASEFEAGWQAYLTTRYRK